MCALVKTFGIVFFIISVFCLSTTVESDLIATMHVGNAHNITDMGKCAWFQESMTFNLTDEQVIYFSLLKTIVTCNIFFLWFFKFKQSALFVVPMHCWCSQFEWYDDGPDHSQTTEDIEGGDNMEW